MGEKSRQRSGRARHRSKARRLKVDERFSFGPIEISRSGRYITFTNHATPAEHIEIQAHQARKHAELCQEIDELVEKIAVRMASMPPVEVMHRAYSEFLLANSTVEPMSEDEVSTRANETRFFLEYCQSVLVSVPSTPGPAESIEEEDWSELRGLVTRLRAALILPYFMTRSARAADEDSNYDFALDFVSTQAQMYWLGVRGERYQALASEHLRDFLLPQDVLLQEAWGVTAEQIVSGYQALADSLTKGVWDAAAAANPELPVGEILRQAVAQKGLGVRMNRMSGRMFGLDVFDVLELTAWPEELVSALSLGPGEDADGSFFADGDQRGWPLRVSPTWNKPFLTLGGRYYCFNLYALDRLHYILARLVRDTQPTLKKRWDDNQKVATEGAAIGLLRKLLPGATVYAEVYYRSKTTSKAKKKNWCECDAVFVLDDHVFVVEIKSGTYTYTSPADDFDAHLKSIRGLLVEPTRQGRRFVEYLRSAPEVGLHDAEHEEVGRLRLDEYRRVVVCSITFDQVTQLAATVQYSTVFRDEMGTEPAWCVSVDDLRVVTEMIEGPSQFVHYLEQRLAAYDVDVLGPLHNVDELDHLGMYFAINHYVEHFAEFGEDNRKVRLDPHGYAAVFDKYYSAIALGKEPERPRQHMPDFYQLILAALDESNSDGRLFAAKLLLDLGGDARVGLSDGVASLVDHVRAGGNPRLLTISPQPISVACAMGTAFDDATKRVLRDQARVRAIRAENTRQLVFWLQAPPVGPVVLESFELLDIESMPLEEQRRLKLQSDAVASRDVEKRQRESGKIGRNEPCPCGSGKKYKRCCLT